MKAYELLSGKSSAYIAKATSKGFTIKIRVVRSKSKNDLNTWQAEIRVFVKGEKWTQCHWFNCENTIDEILDAIKEKFPHIDFKKEIKTVEKANRHKRTKTQKPAYYIKTTGKVGQPTTIKTDKPLFRI